MGMSHKIPPAASLPNKPLLEAVFELRWKIVEAQPGFGKDPGFSILHGRYYDFARTSGYSEVVSLNTAQLPEDMAPYSPRYQYWTGKKKWPVTQIGPGVMTFNSTKEYKWENFFPAVQKAIRAIYSNYPNEIFLFVPTQVSLRYIDIIPFDKNGGKSLPDFLRENFHTDIKIRHDIFSQGKEATTEDIKLSLKYKLNSPKGIGKINLGNGVHEGATILGWDTEIRSIKEDVPQSLEEMDEWLVNAHDTSKKWFYALTDGPLLQSFK